MFHVSLEVRTTLKEESSVSCDNFFCELCISKTKMGIIIFVLFESLGLLIPISPNSI